MNNLKTHLICLECPNGCNLKLDWKTDANVSVSEHQCVKGVVFAARVLKKEHETHISVDACPKHLNKEILSEIVSSWGITLKKLHYDIDIQGSPERTVFRVVVEDDKNVFYLLEEIAPKTLLTKQKIAKTLEFLSEKNLSHIESYLKNKKEDCITLHEGRLWQMMRFVKGVELFRPDYIYEQWRGGLLADFLIELKAKSRELPFFREEQLFSIKKYIYRLVREIKTRRKDIEERVDDVVHFLEKDFFDVHDDLSVCFCHGDYHPMNIVWGDKEIKCVIDWEFSGIKPEIYDMCNLIGCVGVEHPSSLHEGLVVPFVQKIREAKIFSDISLKYLIEFIVALRFAWLSEWLRREDEEMIDLELTYMGLLIEDRKRLRKRWMLPA